MYAFYHFDKMCMDTLKVTVPGVLIICLVWALEIEMIARLQVSYFDLQLSFASFSESCFRAVKWFSFRLK